MCFTNVANAVVPQRIRQAIHKRVNRIYSNVTIIIHTLIIPLSIVQTCFIATLPLFWPLLGVYATQIRIDSTPESGMPFSWYQLYVRKLGWWRAFANYYPITLHKTVDLEPSSPPVVPCSSWPSISWMDTPLWFVAWPFVLTAEVINRILGRPSNAKRTQKKIPASPHGRKYLFAICPHGIISMGAFCSMGTEGANWSALFPGVLTHVLTLASNFYFPFYRQYLLALGIASVSKTSCMNLLNNNQNIGIVVGGARESLLAEPGRFDVILNCRKGFVKVALRTGATIVPVISFGENDIYEQVKFEEGSRGDRILKWMSHNVGFTLPLFHARGLFGRKKGFLAYNRPINVVIGRPIEVPFEENPSQALVDEYHAIYIRELKQLFEENVNKFTPGVELNIVD